MLAAESIIDELCTNGGLHLYDQYLKTKDTPHCAMRLIQFFEEGVQFSFFPGDPGEGEEEFDENWTPDDEPMESEIDHWATKIVKVKQVVKVENDMDDGVSSIRSKRAPSIASSRKTFKMRKLHSTNRKDSESRSKLGDSMRERGTDRKENQNMNISIHTISQAGTVNQNLNLIPLDVEPPREIPEDEKYLRDRKDKQTKMKELEMKEQREKEERERLRMKNKQDAFAEIEKHEYTYDTNGKIMMVKKPNIQRLPGSIGLAPEFQLNPQQSQHNSMRTGNVQMKSRARLQSAKPPMQKEMKVIKEQRKEESILQEKAEQELEDKYKALFDQQNESLKDFGIQKDPMEVCAGIVMTDKEGKRMRGPAIDRTNKMTLQEYQKVASNFEVMSEEKLSRYGSAKKLLSQENAVSQLDYIQEDNESLDYGTRRRSPDKIAKNLGADEVYEREITYTQHKQIMKAKRKDLKSANVKTLNQKVLDHHNKEVRVTSAKQQQDVRIRRTSSKVGLREKIFNYENHIGGVDFPTHHEVSRHTESRPMSGISNLLNKKSMHQLPSGKNPSSLIDEFNKKLVEKGTSYPVLPSELPKVSNYLQKRQDRPQTSKPISQVQKKKLNPIDMNEGGNFGKQSQLGLISELPKESGFLNTKTQAQKKGPRERIISAKLPKDHDKLPPPPFGKTMGHGLLNHKQ